MNILVIAPHPDDEILGAGGTILKHIAHGDHVYVCIVTKGCNPLFSETSVNRIRAEAKDCHTFLGIKETYYLDFPAAMIEKIDRYEINDKIFKVISKVRPEIVYIPHHGDMQKDHQIVSEASMVALRPKYSHVVRKILAYETLSETEWNIPHSMNAFMPNLYHDISEYLEYKLEAMNKYTSQLADFPNPRSLIAIEALAKYRGSTINARAAEAFVLLREIV